MLLQEMRSEPPGSGHWTAGCGGPRRCWGPTSAFYELRDCFCMLAGRALSINHAPLGAQAPIKVGPRSHPAVKRRNRPREEEQASSRLRGSTFTAMLALDLDVGLAPGSGQAQRVDWRGYLSPPWPFLAQVHQEKSHQACHSWSSLMRLWAHGSFLLST